MVKTAFKRAAFLGVIALILAAALLTVTGLYADAAPLDGEESDESAGASAESMEASTLVFEKGVSDDYDSYVGTVGSATETTQNVFVAVGRGMTVTSFNGTAYVQGTLDVSATDSDLVLVEEYINTIGTGNTTAGVRFRGLKAGKTTFKIGENEFTLYVVPGMSNYARNSKTVKIKASDIVNCDAYFSVNASDLYEISTSNYLINQIFVGGFQIGIFGAPKDGYALTEVGVTGSAGQYYSLNGSLADGSDSEAWPFNNPDAVDKNDSQGYKTDKYNKTHGFATPFQNNNDMTVQRLRELFTQANELGCDGAAQFGNYRGGDNRDTKLTFKAQRLPTMKKYISNYKNPGEDEWNTYDPANPPVLEIGSAIRYVFEITRYNADEVEYSDIMLKDEPINYEKKFDVPEDPVNKPVFTFETDYVLKEEDIAEYAGGQFHNSAQLTYNYKSKYSDGKFKATTSAGVTCEIKKIMSFTWCDHLPDDIKEQLTLPIPRKLSSNKSFSLPIPDVTSYPVYAGEGANRYQIGSWNFACWGYTNKDSGIKEYFEADFEHPLIMPDIDSVTFSGHWYYTDGTTKTVTYEWVGLEDVENVNEKLPVDGGRYYVNQTFKIHNVLETGDVLTFDGVMYKFSGWTYGTETVSGTMVMPDVAEDGITLKGNWEKLGNSATLTVAVSDATSLTVNEELQTFLYRITGDGVDITVAANKENNFTVVIGGLKVGSTYNVTEVSDWSWRFKPDESSVSVEITTQSNTVSFSHTVKETRWFNGSNYFADIFRKKQRDDG